MVGAGFNCNCNKIQKPRMEGTKYSRKVIREQTYNILISLPPPPPSTALKHHPPKGSPWSLVMLHALILTVNDSTSTTNGHLNPKELLESACPAGPESYREGGEQAGH